MLYPFGVVRAISTMEVIEELIRLAKELDVATAIDLTLREGERAKIGSLAAAACWACGLCFERQRRGAYQPRATPWDCVVIWFIEP